MFDIDGTLVQSDAFDTHCFAGAIEEVLGLSVDSDWSKYEHVTDAGILDEIVNTNALAAEKSEIERKVKTTFICKIEEHLKQEPAQEVPGALSFLSRLALMDDFIVSIATGGWYETAMLKLSSAGFDVSGIAMATANDHVSRMEIMKIAAAKAIGNGSGRINYFGNGVWDKVA
ncbi:HAD family hydrolase [Planctomycetota bacterium]